MQQTKLDRMMQRKFVQRTQIFCNTLPYAIPPGVEVDETTAESGGRYLYRLTAPNDAALNELTAHLEVANITYTARIKDEEGLAGKIFNNPNKSFTMQIAWVIFTIIIISVLISGLPVKIWNDLTADVEYTIEPPKKIKIKQD
jgi:hypothetical protein